MKSSTKNGLLVALAVAVGFGMGMKPVLQAREQEAEAVRQAALAAADEQRRHEDMATEGRLSTEVGKEEFLRKRGFRKPGERPLSL